MTLTPETISGVWKLSRFVYCWPDGRELAPLGDAVGQLVYLLERECPGRMAVQVAAVDRPPIDPASDASLAIHFRSSFAYAGQWSLEEEWVHHDVDIASLKFWENTRLTRSVRLASGRLVLTTEEPSPQMPEGGYTTVLEWTR